MTPAWHSRRGTHTHLHKKRCQQLLLAHQKTEVTGQTTAPRVGEAEMLGVLEGALRSGSCGENHAILDWSNGPWRLRGDKERVKALGDPG